MTSYLKRPELHIIQGNKNTVLKKLEEIDKKVDSLRGKSLPVSDTAIADSGVTTFEQENEKPDTVPLGDIPIIEDMPIEVEKNIEASSGIITKEDMPISEYINEVVKEIPRPQLALYQRVLRLFKNIIKCFKEF